MPRKTRASSSARSNDADVDNKNNSNNNEPDDGNTPLSPRARRQLQREALKAKATGLTVIDRNYQRQKNEAPDNTTPNKRIVFPEEGVADKDASEDDVVVAEKEAVEPTAAPGVSRGADKAPETSVPAGHVDKGGSIEGNDDDDDDDDAVEEVKTSTAREAERAKRSMERDSARASLQKKAKKRKRKNQDESERQETNDDHEFDEDFFRQLEEEKQLAREAKKRAKKLERQPKGQHTTFIVTEEDEITTLPTNERGVQVALVPSPLHAEMSEPTEEAFVYSRARLENGGDGLSAKQIQKAKKRKQKPVEKPSWQRSTKMNRILARGSSRRIGSPALHFTKTKK